MNLKELGVKRVIVRANTRTQKEILEKVGVDEVVLPDEEMGRRIAQKLLFPSLLDLIPLSDGHSIARIGSPESFIGKKLFELDLRKKYGVNVIAIKKGNGNTKIDNIPSPDYRIEKGDILVVIAPNSSLEKITGGKL